MGERAHDRLCRRPLTAPVSSSPSLGLALSFTAGLLSFLSPCVLPLIPSYITFITGLSLEDVQQSRRTALVHGLLFVAGFTLIFLALGATATVLGQLLNYQRIWISRVGGVLIIVFGLYMLGVFNVSMFSREKRVHIADKPVGYLGTVLVGIAFGAGWTPCIGPILGSILTYAASAADVSRGLVLLLAYSLGLAVPFVISAVAVDRFMGFFHRVKRQMVWVSRIAGALMIAVGILMVTNYFTILASYLQALTPEALKGRL
jgi:cytochrome c-type biogenesis protein